MKSYALAALLMGSMTVGFSACRDLSDYALDPPPEGEKCSMMATCVAVSAPYYYAADRDDEINGYRVSWNLLHKPFWYQEVKVRTRLGRPLSGPIIIDGPSDRISKGQREVAVFREHRGDLVSFGGRKAVWVCDQQLIY